MNFTKENFWRNKQLGEARWYEVSDAILDTSEVYWRTINIMGDKFHWSEIGQDWRAVRLTANGIVLVCVSEKEAKNLGGVEIKNSTKNEETA